jgi:hypothetical protein
MFRALPALLFVLLPAVAPSTWLRAGWAQTAPPPDTKPARERHRLQDREAPPPEGPWGPEEAGLTWRNPVWRGAVAAVSTYAGSSLNTDLPRALAASSDGVNPPIFESVQYHGESFRTVSATVAADLDMFRLSFTWFDGTWDAHATFTRDDGVLPPESRDLDLDGDLFGFRFGAYWPAFRYRDFLVEASVGPAVSVGWMHQETEEIPGAALKRDTIDILTGSLGPKVSFRLFPGGKWAVELDAEYSYLAGSVRGWTREFSAGVGYKF